ncbi:hypothetical protein Agau_C200906 [Agrobacterium tumefaciens F2]|nr:hypothetical protein Agau_C200906 [Agrobacterium tumefaciens F2]
MRVKAAPELRFFKSGLLSAVAAIWLFYSILARPMLIFRYQSR